MLRTAAAPKHPAAHCDVVVNLSVPEIGRCPTFWLSVVVDWLAPAFRQSTSAQRRPERGRRQASRFIKFGKSNRISIFSTAILLIAGLTPSPAQACGSVQHWVAKYDDAAYTAVAQVHNMSKCPKPEALRTWYVAVGDYVIIRSRPNKSSSKPGWIRRGAVVRVSRSTDEWLEITDWHGQKGFIYRPLVQDYTSYDPTY